MLAETSPEDTEDVWSDPPTVVECRRVRPLLEKFFQRWPSAKAARDASEQEVQDLIEPIQRGEHAAQLIIRFSGQSRLADGATLQANTAWFGRFVWQMVDLDVR